MLKSIKGNHAKVTIPALGAVVGLVEPPDGWWELTAIRREGEKSGNPTTFRFRAIFSYPPNLLFTDDRFKKKLVVQLSRDKQYRLEWPEDQRMELSGRSLLIEGVTLCPET